MSSHYREYNKDLGRPYKLSGNINTFGCVRSKCAISRFSSIYSRTEVRFKGNESALSQLEYGSWQSTARKRGIAKMADTLFALSTR